MGAAWRMSGVPLVLIYLIAMAAEVILRCSWILLVLIYLIKMWVWHMLKLDSDVHGYYWY